MGHKCHRQFLDEQCKQFIIDGYKDGKSICQLTKETGHHRPRLRKILLDAGLEIRDANTSKRLVQGWESINGDIFKSENLTPELAWVCGWIASDGHLFRDKDGFIITIHEQDRDVLEKMWAIFDIQRNLRYIIRKSPNRGNQVSLAIYGRNIKVNLALLGMDAGTKTKTLRFPYLPDHLMPHYVRGEYEGDGCIQAYMCNVSMAIQLQFCAPRHYLNDLKKYLGIHLETSTKIKLIPADKSGICYRLIYGLRDSIIIASWMYRDSTPEIRCNRKYQRTEDAMKKYVSLLPDIVNRRTFSTKISKTLFLINKGCWGYYSWNPTIRSIEIIKNELNGFVSTHNELPPDNNNLSVYGLRSNTEYIQMFGFTYGQMRKHYNAGKGKLWEAY